MRKAEIILDYQNYIEAAPVAPQQMYAQAASGDNATIAHWRKTWVDNIKANKAKFGSFKEHGVGKLLGIMKHKPAIIVGSGPSLKVNYKELANRDGIAVVSCLHNFHLLEDAGVSADYYVSLDAGPIVLEEISEGGTKTPEEYWELTKDRTLIAYIGSDPRLFEKWKGKVYLFSAMLPDEALMKEIFAIDDFKTFVSNGGNVLGACLYVAKGFMGANPIAFIGADFAFGYDRKFHAWDSKYDANLGHVIRAVDIYGNKVLTWQSYANFKAWFDWLATQVPGIYINCTEGGTFGSYFEGNIMAVRQMELKNFLQMYRLHEELRDQCENTETKQIKLLF